MIKRLVAFDFDGTLMKSPTKEEGLTLWYAKNKKPYPHHGWWGRPESLDLNVFDIKPYPSVLNQLEDEMAKPNTFTIILTSRMEKLRHELEKVLDKNHIKVDKVDMKRSNLTKGEKILRYVQNYPDLEEISVFDDRDGDIESYESIRSELPKKIKFNIYRADEGKLSLLENKSKILNIINEEIQKII